MSPVEGWLQQHRRLVVLILVVAAVGLRGVYFAQLNAGPCIALHHAAETDMHYFDEWGRAIARGDWLSASVGTPIHTWHHAVAEQYFTNHPEQRAALEQQAARAGNGVSAERLLWSQWTGGHQFYQDPLHAYLIGLTYAVAGSDPRFVFAWQMALGVLTTVLIYVLARRYFGDVTAVVAGALALLCGPLVYYELLLLRDSTIAWAGLALVWLADRVIARDRWPGFAILGFALGAAVLLKSSFALLALLFTAGIVVHYRRAWRRAVVAAGSLVLGMALAFGPLAARNLALGVPPIALAGSGTLTFVTANDVTYPATGGFEVNNERLGRVMADTGGRPLPAALETLRAHTVATFVTVLWHKFENVWHWYEIPNNDNFYYMRLRAPVLAWLPVTFFVIAPLGLVGLVLSARTAKDAWLLHVLVFSCAVSLTLFLVLGRLRVSLAAALIPYAALTVATCMRARPRALAAVGAALVLIGLWTGRPLPAGEPLIALTDWLTPFAAQYQERVRQAMDRNDPGSAADSYLEFLAYEPDFARMPRNGLALSSNSDREVASTFAQIHAVCARLLADSGRPARGEVELRRARELSALAGETSRP